MFNSGNMRKTDYLITLLSQSNRLEDFMNKYQLWRLQDATLEQLEEYILHEIYQEGNNDCSK